MRVTYIEVQVGLTKNLGNYESAKIAYTFGATLDDDETVSKTKNTIRDHLVKEINKDISKIVFTPSQPKNTQPISKPKNFK